MLAITPVTVTVLDDDGNGVVGQMVAVCPERQRCLVQLVQGGVFEEEEYELIDVAVHTGRFDGPDYKSTSPESVSKLFRETVCSEREGYQLFWKRTFCTQAGRPIEPAVNHTLHPFWNLTPSMSGRSPS